MRIPLLLSLLVLSLSACREEEQVEAVDIVRPVRTLEATLAGGLHDRFFVGVARAAREATLAFGVPGTIQLIDVTVGDTVPEGSVLARLDPSPLEAEVERLVAELQSAEASFENARLQTQRQRTLVEKEVAAEAKLDKFIATETSAEATVKAVQASLRKARLDLSYTRITSPYDGIIVARFAEDFEEVTSQTRILRVLDSKHIEMIIEVPERFITVLEDIEDIRVTFGALGDMELPAEVTEVGTEASRATGTFPVTLQMIQPEGHPILPGMTGRARGTPKAGSMREAGIFVPAAAVFIPEGQDDPHVWIVDKATMTVSERPVRVGPAGSLGVGIEEGVEPGEIVVAAGANSLRSGQSVSLLDGEAN